VLDSPVARVLTVFGTRPEAIKLAPVLAAIEGHPRLSSLVCISSQHRDLLPPLLDHFGVLPRHDLDVMRTDQTLAELTARVLTGVAGVIEQESPDVVVVHGDTTTTLAASLAAFYAGVPIAHVEAGLRTADLRTPFPEELNRRLTDRIAAVHYAPTETAAERLRAEGATDVLVTGNTGIDALLRSIRPGVVPRRSVLVTCHRREVLGERLVGICRALAEIPRRHPGFGVLYPVHPNPTVRRTVHEVLDGVPGVTLCEPMAYPAFVRALQACHLVLTDSGGLQEEAPSLDKPVLVMRDVTERTEGIETGALRLVGTEPSRILAALDEVLGDREVYDRMASAENPYGDGRAAERIVDDLALRF